MENEKQHSDKRQILIGKLSAVFPFALMETLTPSTSKPLFMRPSLPPSIRIPTALSLSLSDRWVGNEFRLSPSNSLGTKNCPPKPKMPF